MSTPNLSPSDSIEGKPIKRKQFKLPKELDILPPRPVLFPWLPNFEQLDCCGSKNTRTTRQTSKFSFDLGNASVVGTKEQAGTPVTAPLSPANEDDEDAMPDMSSSSSSSRSNPGYQRERQQQLNSLTDVIAEVLKVIFFMLSMKRTLLRQNGEEDQRRQKALMDQHIANSKREKEIKLSTNNQMDIV